MADVALLVHALNEVPPPPGRSEPLTSLGLLSSGGLCVTDTVAAHAAAVITSHSKHKTRIALGVRNSTKPLSQLQ